ncbi:MAG: transglycosylase domain-containing protein [Lachnospiraceae bacterium]|nr:transglycosylase domain-containing protein [Lachnospiraceae bacterium]
MYAILRAIRAYIINKGEIHQGASTITQQLARNVYLSGEVSMKRKITEIFLAAGLEEKYSKRQILEFYLNNIYFANGYYGIQAAANGYFSKTVSSLSLSQIAFLCAIPNNPTNYDPIVNFDNTIERRDKVLLQMLEGGYITQEEYDNAVKAKIKLKFGSSQKHDYAETYTYYCATRALMERNGFVFRYSFESDEDRSNYRDLYYEIYNSTQRSLFTGGYRIYTTLERDKMEEIREAIASNLEFEETTNDEGIYKLQSSAACIDNKTGFVVAIAGGREQEYAGYTLNRAYMSPRQPGSSIKPLVVYTPLFEKGEYPDMKVVDERFPGGPRNSSGVYSGEIDVRYAVENSKNTVAWKLFEELTPRVGLSYLLSMRFSSIVESDYVPAAALGGLTYGATAVEMSSAYAAIENDGIFRNPTCIERITDSRGRVIASNLNMPERVYAQNAARIMTDVLTGVLKRGTARKIKVDGQIAAGKTGTTNDQKDGWFVGYTRYYTTAVWVGYDYPKKLDGLMGNTYPAYIWQDYMNSIHKGLKAVDFEMYTDNRPKTEEPAEDEDLEEGEEPGEDDPEDGEDSEGEDGEPGDGENPSDGGNEEPGDGEDGEPGDGDDTDAEPGEGTGDDGGIIWIKPDY